MQDFNKPIRPINKDDDNEKKTEKILEKFEENKSFEMENYKENNKKNFLLSYLSIVKNFFKSLSFAKPKESQLHFILNSLLAGFKQLCEKKPKENTLVLKKIALAWTALVKEGQDHPKKKLDQLIDALQRFSLDNSFSLDYYFQHFSAEDWFPLPFYELIEKLHDDYFSNKKNSDLDRWIHLIEEILEEN